MEHKESKKITLLWTNTTVVVWTLSLRTSILILVETN